MRLPKIIREMRGDALWDLTKWVITLGGAGVISTGTALVQKLRGKQDLVIIFVVFIVSVLMMAIGFRAPTWVNSKAKSEPPVDSNELLRMNAGVDQSISVVFPHGGPPLPSTGLLFPWVVFTGDGQFDTGIAISNTTSDPAVIGTTGETGDVNLYFFPSDGTASLTVTFHTALKPGQTATGTASNLTKKPFRGYMIAICNFRFGQGYASIDSPRRGFNSSPQGYLAVDITKRLTGA